MANVLTKALDELAGLQRRMERSKKADKARKMSTAAAVQKTVDATVTIAGGAAAGMADGMVDGEIYGLTAGEVGSAAVAVLAFSGIVGGRSAHYLERGAVGGLSYAAGRRAYEMSHSMNLLSGAKDSIDKLMGDDAASAGIPPNADIADALV